VGWIVRPGDYRLRFVVEGRAGGSPFRRELVRTLRVEGSGPSGEIERLLRELGDPDFTVRAAAARELGRRKAVVALPALTEMIDDPSETVRREAAWAAKRIRESR